MLENVQIVTILVLDRQRCFLHGQFLKSGWTRKSWCTSSAEAAKCSESETQFVLLSKLLQDTYQLRQPQWLLPLLTNILYIGISTLLLTSIIKSPNSTHFQHPSHLPLSNANINLLTVEYVTAPGQYMRTRLTTNCIPHDYWRKKKTHFSFHVFLISGILD